MYGYVQPRNACFHSSIITTNNANHTPEPVEQDKQGIYEGNLEKFDDKCRNDLFWSNSQVENVFGREGVVKTNRL